jgi:hypothetical protein
MPGIPMPFFFAAWGLPAYRSEAVPSFTLMNRRSLHEFQDMLGNFLALLLLEEMTGFPDDHTRLLPGGRDQAAEENITSSQMGSPWPSST